MSERAANPPVEIFEEISSLPQRLYHYCPPEAFLKILETRSLWLSEATALNDAREVSLTHDLLLGSLSSPPPGVPAGTIDRVREVLDLNRPYPFVGALSMLGDQLGQWRGYADDGYGVSIGFDPSRFKLKYYLPFTAQNPALTVGLAPVIYSETMLRDAIEAQLSLLARRLATKAMDEDNAVIEAATRLGQLTCIGKNPAFSEEHEWRIIHVPLAAPWINGGRVILKEGALADVRFRVSKGALIPFFACACSGPCRSPIPAQADH